MEYVPSGADAAANGLNLAQIYAQEAQERVRQATPQLYYSSGDQSATGAPHYLSRGDGDGPSAMGPAHPHHPGAVDADEEGIDEEPLSNRGESWSELLACLTSPLLRIGLLLQLLVLLFGFALYYGHGGSGVFTFDLFSMPETLRTSQPYCAILIVLESAFLVGCVCIASFQIYVADNSKLTRGFRSGSKVLSTAALLDTFVIGLRLMQSIYAYHFLGDRWWMKYTQSSADWCLFYSGTWVHSIALVLYGFAFFYMEAYQDEGTYEEWSWVMLGLFGLASLFEFLLVFTGFGSFFMIFHVLALGAAAVWAFSFEPLLHYHSPVFHDRDLNADIPVTTYTADGNAPDKQSKNGFVTRGAPKAGATEDVYAFSTH